MAIDRKTVENVARLSRLAISEAEKDSLTEQLAKIIAHVDELKALDTQNIEPTAHPFAAGDPSREDVHKNWGPTEPILQNAPQREEFFFQVPKVIEG